MAIVMRETNSGETRPEGAPCSWPPASRERETIVTQGSKYVPVRRKHSVSLILWQKGEVICRTLSGVWKGNVENVRSKIYKFLIFYIL